MNERILVVDDEQPIREVVCSMLASNGYQCEEAQSGNTALSVLNSGHQFDMILTGLMMPDLGGLGLMERLNAEYPLLPVLVVTAVYEPSVALACFRLGAYDYLLKPFERGHLLWVVRTALTNHEQRSRNSVAESTLDILFSSRIAEWQKLVPVLVHADEAALETGLRVAKDDWQPRQVSELAKRLALALDLSGERVKSMALAAKFHAVGEIPVFRNILLQPKIMRPEELALMCQFRQHIYQAMKSIHILGEAAEISHSYAEHFDGTGYPRGLKGSEIPLEARILSAVYMVEHFKYRFPYNKPPTMEATYAELQRLSGQQFDPEVVGALLSVEGKA